MGTAGFMLGGSAIQVLHAQAKPIFLPKSL